MRLLKEALGEKYLDRSGKIRPGPVQKFTDWDVVVLNLTAECLSINSENNLFHKLNSDYKNDFPYLISRRQYNDRRKILITETNELRKVLVEKLNMNTEVFTIDSTPLDLCKYSRAIRSKICQDNECFVPDVGYCAAQDRKFYGGKLHAVCSPSGVIQYFDITSASIHDIHFLKDVRCEFTNCIIVGDKGYLSQQYKERLWNEANICLETPYRKNQKNGKQLMPELRKIRKRIETVFSQLDSHFKIRENLAKSFKGLITRIISKIAGMTLLNFMNKINGRPIGKIKNALM